MTREVIALIDKQALKYTTLRYEYHNLRLGFGKNLKTANDVYIVTLF